MTNPTTQIKMMRKIFISAYRLQFITKSQWRNLRQEHEDRNWCIDREHTLTGLLNLFSYTTQDHLPRRDNTHIKINQEILALVMFLGQFNRHNYLFKVLFIQVTNLFQVDKDKPANVLSVCYIVTRRWIMRWITEVGRWLSGYNAVG